MLPSWVTLLLVLALVVAFTGCVLQILWLRKKLADYSDTQMAANLAKQAVQLSAPTSNVQVYSLVVNVQLTRGLNHASNPDFIAMQNVYAPMTFSLPQTCGGVFSTASISCNKIAFLVLEPNQGAASLTIDLLQGGIFYLMIKQVLYVASYIPDFSLEAFRSSKVVCLYTIQSAKNIPSVTGCNVGLVPFFGTVSDDATTDIKTLLALDSGSVSLPLHALGVMAV